MAADYSVPVGGLSRAAQLPQYQGKHVDVRRFFVMLVHRAVRLHWDLIAGQGRLRPLYRHYAKECMRSLVFDRPHFRRKWLIAWKVLTEKALRHLCSWLPILPSVIPWARCNRLKRQILELDAPESSYRGWQRHVEAA